MRVDFTRDDSYVVRFYKSLFQKIDFDKCCIYILLHHFLVIDVHKELIIFRQFIVSSFHNFHSHVDLANHNPLYVASYRCCTGRYVALYSEVVLYKTCFFNIGIWLLGHYREVGLSSEGPIIERFQCTS